MEREALIALLSVGELARQVRVLSSVVYFSTNAVLGGPETQLSSRSRSQTLAVRGSYQVTNTVTIPANAPPSYYLILKTDDQNALFEANETNNWRAFGVGQSRDSDGGGLPDWWEEQYFGSTANCAPDPDSDGMTNHQEYLADKNPTSDLSVLRISGVVSEAGGVRLEWQGGAQAKQYVQRTDDLSAPAPTWTAIHTNVPPTPLQTNLFDSPGTNRTLFYRVRAVRN